MKKNHPEKFISSSSLFNYEMSSGIEKIKKNKYKKNIFGYEKIILSVTNSLSNLYASINICFF